MNIKVDNLTVCYGQAALFANVRFDVQTGQKICIAGQSGSGKSTLLKALMGLVVPTQGDITIGAESLTEKSVWHLRSKIAYVAQEPDLGEGPVIDRIRRPFGYHANAHLEWDRRAVSDYCCQFRLDEKMLDKDISDLSGGEKQRIAITIALLLRRPILLLDEPFSALDKEIKAIVKKELISDLSRTILFVSHESTLLEIADDTIDLNFTTGAGQ
ncbi:MAG: ATP-binding cassette domain-containing protein [Phycisphaerae bacterium]|nr:ATP-binding cassette domain-containing protein [Phycisphaerae bacterium]